MIMKLYIVVRCFMVMDKAAKHVKVTTDRNAVFGLDKIVENYENMIRQFPALRIHSM